MSILAIDSRVATALVVGGGLLLFGLLLVITAAGEMRGRRRAKVPPAMRPAASDEELERRVIPKQLAWAAGATLLMAAWLPVYWILEPGRMERKADQMQELMIHGIHGGEKIYEEFCLRCHGAEGDGVIATYTVNGEDQAYAEPPLKYVYARYKASGRNEDEITQLVYDAINRGRPGTPMPTWALAFGGPFNTFQVDSVVEYIKSIQVNFEGDLPEGGKALFDQNCAVCHGPGGRGQDEAGNPTVGPNLTVTLRRITIDQVRETIEDGRLNVNRPSMPAWAFLGEDAVDALVRYVRSIQRGR